MTWHVEIVDGGHRLALSHIGEVLVRPFDYSDPVFNVLDVINTASNFFIPHSGEQLIVTGIIVFADRDVTTQTQIDIYEASSLTSTTIDKQIRRIDLAKLEGHIETGLTLKINAGVFLNAKCDDDDVFLTIDGYYIPLERAEIT